MVRGPMAGQAPTFSRLNLLVPPMHVNGAARIVSRLGGGRPFSVMGFTVRRGKIVEIDTLADRARLRHLDLTAVNDRRQGVYSVFVPPVARMRSIAWSSCWFPKRVVSSTARSTIWASGSNAFRAPNTPT